MLCAGPSPSAKTIPCRQMDVSDLDGRLLFAVPKKGRLHEKALQLLAGADIQFHRKSRTDIALSSNLPIALVFLPAVDIAKFVGEGNVDLGITGQDVIAEAGEDTVGNVDEVLKLGFGKCRLCLQVPVSSPYREPRDLLGKKVATSFENLASRYFEKLGEEVAGSVPLNGVVKKSKTRVVSVSGSVEASCSLGLADGIVDLVESGETMHAAGLHAIADIMTSEAVLIANRRTASPELLRKIASRILGFLNAQRYVYFTYNVHVSKLPEVVRITPGRRAPTISPLDDSEWRAVGTMVVKDEEAETLDKLSTAGATDIMVFGIQNCRNV